MATITKNKIIIALWIAIFLVGLGAYNLGYSNGWQSLYQSMTDSYQTEIDELKKDSDCKDVDDDHQVQLLGPKNDQSTDSSTTTNPYTTCLTN